jgi:DNA-binding transcriptional regulator YdaS (Cro superfamily)
LNAQPIAHVYEMSPRRKFRVAPGFIWTGNRASLAEALGVDISYLEACERGEERAPASLAKLIRQLTGGAVDLEVRKPGRPPKKLEHPLAQWIDANRAGDRQSFAGEIGITIEHLRDVLNYRGDLSTRKAREIKQITGLSWEALLGE